MGKLLAFRPVSARARRSELHRHAPRAPRSCDFCLTSDPAWRYQCRDFAACEVCHQVVETSRRVLAEPSDTPRLRDFCSAPRLAAWGYPRLNFVACDVCHQLIEAGDRTGLADRTYETAPVPPDLKSAPGSRKAMMAVIRELTSSSSGPRRRGQFFCCSPSRSVHFARPCLGAWGLPPVDSGPLRIFDAQERPSLKVVGTSAATVILGRFLFPTSDSAPAIRPRCRL